MPVYCVWRGGDCVLFDVLTQIEKIKGEAAILEEISKLEIVES